MEEIKDKYAIQKEIKKLEDKIYVLKGKLNKSLIKDIDNNYIGQYVKIIDKKEPDYYHVFMHVKKIVPNNINLNFFTLQGPGFSYNTSDGYIDERGGTFSEVFNKIINKSEIYNGSIRIDVLTKEQYEEEMRNMIKFMSNIMTYENT